MSEATDTGAPKPPIGKRAAHTVRTLRWWAVLPLPLLIIVVNSFGPDGWREPLGRLLWLSWAAVFLALAHGARRAIFPAADSKTAWKKSLESAEGAGLSFIGICLFTAVIFFGLVSLARAQDVHTFIPAQARALLPQLRDVQRGYWPDMPMPSYVGALIEQESCISLTHSKCWNSRAQLKTDREEGAGLGQFTRAYTSSGALRFDAIAEVRALDPQALAEFSWATVYTRADLSMKAILVKLRDCFRRLERQTEAAPREIVAFCDAAYSGGLGGLLQDRRLCAATPGCDPQRWFDNVENTSGKSRQKWQGYGESAYAINRGHVRKVLTIRRAKYQPALGFDLV